MQLAPAPVAQNLASASSARIPRRYEYFDVPEFTPMDQRELKLDQTRYAILSIGFVLMNVEEEKKVASRAGLHASNALYIAALRATEAMRVIVLAPIVSGLDPKGQPVDTFDPASATEFATSTVDATAEGAYAGMHPGMRELVMLAYGSIASVDDSAAALFLKSRRSVTR